MFAIILTAACCQFDLIGTPEAFDLVGDVPLILTPTKLSEPTRLPYVFGYTKERCPPCETLKQDAPRLNSPRIELKDPPDWALSKSFPVLHWETPSGWKMQEGWYGAGKFLDTYDKSMKSVPASAITPPTRVVVSNRHGLYYGSHPSGWSWPGDLRHHLSTTHGYDAGYLAGLSDAQVIAIHDADHNSGGPGGGRRKGLIGFFNTR